MDKVWTELYKAAIAVKKERRVSDYVETGGIAAAILSKTKKIYMGVCVDTCSTLGICAERNAIFNMLTNGDDEIARILTVKSDGKTISPCGACRELIVQLMPKSYQSIKIMLDYDQNKVITLGSLTPHWWI